MGDKKKQVSIFEYNTFENYILFTNGGVNFEQLDAGSLNSSFPTKNGRKT